MYGKVEAVQSLEKSVRLEAATEVLVYAALRYECMRPYATSV